MNKVASKLSNNLFINICLKRKKHGFTKNCIIINNNIYNTNLKNGKYSTPINSLTFRGFGNSANNIGLGNQMNGNDDPQKKGEQMFSLFENNKIQEELIKKSSISNLNEIKTNGEYENVQPYTDFIFDKCKANINNDLDPYENSWYFNIVYELLNSTKILLDCSWLVSIIATTTFLRLIILPLTISAERDRRKQKILNPVIKEFTNKLKTHAQSGNIKKALEYKTKILNIRNTHGISLVPKSIILMIFMQTPLFFIFYFSMKKIASYPEIFKEFTFESPLWLDSLSLPDPYCILPILSSLLLLSNHELTALIDKHIANNNPNKYDDESEFQKNIKKISKIAMRGFYISSALFFKSMPSGLFIYFITNTFFQLFVTQVCKIKIVENFLDLPPLHSKGLSNDDNNESHKPPKNIHMNDLIKNKKTEKKSTPF
ncbi:preprotein translocase subunit YidC [Plasmodium vinckei petteri]|uniref:Mitochondrial inner membrane protein OXA1, putative n=1 Tax=Plasmodium vinckei petteri TaxID=138298 RepID=W7ABV9_PLAVN|nr:preprotein translocase subunit YidC [Plasmodium vinckei petteri]CAD2101075.1 mitochondrial inner membrane protein OXA1, putative [Plasmodium vinckei petteri]